MTAPDGSGLGGPHLPRSNVRTASIGPGEDTQSVLEEAGQTVGSRDGSHGDPVENHEHIAAMWTAFFGPKLRADAEITAAEVAQAMIHVKHSRAMVGGADRDHFVDIAGYASIAHECTMANRVGDSE